MIEESAPPPDPRIGKVLQDRYRILAKIASGAMGVVYRGERVQLDRPVAIKFLHPWIAAQKAFLSRFETEARAMSRLAHPHCVSVTDFGIDGAPFLVMDFVTGRTLREVMAGGRLPVGRALRIIQQLLSGLAHAHAQGIVHRDLKPENLILSDETGLEEHLRILDFGLAKLRDGPAMTAGMAVGTPSYMSPEQSGASGTIDARSDLYAVGILFFEVLTGRKPFQAENVGELILMQREAPAPLIRQVLPEGDFSPALEAVVLKAMSKMAEDRFQSAAEMAAAIEGTPEGRPAARGGGEARRPAPPSGAKTTVDTVSAVRRRLEAAGLSAPPAAGPTVVDKQPRRPGTSNAPRQWRLATMAGGVLLIAMLGLLVGRLWRGPSSSVATARPEHTAAKPSASSPSALPAAEKPTGPAASPGAAAPASGQPSTAFAAQGLEQARQLMARHETAQALAVLDGLRAAEPDNAEVLYLQAILHFDNRRWTEGVAAGQLAVKKDPTLKSDADLIKGVIQSLVSDRGYERSQALLRSMGERATPFIREAAHRDPSPKVRERASELLGSRGGRGWSSGASPGGSIFRR